jgi:hypothetical protein
VEHGGGSRKTRPWRPLPGAVDVGYGYSMNPTAPEQRSDRRRFEAIAGTARRSWLWMYAGMAAFYGCVAVLNAALPDRVFRMVMPLFIVLGIVGWVVWLVFMFRTRKVMLDVGDEGILVDEGRGGTFPFAGAVLGSWRMAGIGVTTGTVLHLAGGERPFRVAGRDHRPVPALHLEAPPVEYVEAILSAAAFDELLATLPASVFRARWDAPAAPPPLRIALLSNPSSGRHSIRMMLPWLGTIMLVGVLNIGLEAAGVGDSPIVRAIDMPLTIAIVVGGLVLTMVLAVRHRPGLEIEVDDGELRLRDPRKGRTLAAAPIARVEVRRGVHRYSGRGGGFDQVALVLRLSPAHEVSVGVFDARYGWSDAASSVSTPRWIVGPPDWNALVDRLGVGAFVVVRWAR